ncbi:MAG: DUF3108 domain-containing protein [Flavobacteriales bacterium]|nr:DUF3108 domain-containing protein [Flavobacteriales bacterium]
MPIKRVLFFLMLFPLFVFSQNNLPFNVGESCTYRIHYGPITAAHGTLSIKSFEEHNDINCLYFEGIAQTNSFFDFFFKVYDKYVSYVNPTRFSPVHFIRDVNEGGYIIKQNYLFNTEKNEVLSKDSIYKITEKTQDMLSAFYFTRAMLNNQNVKEDSLIKLNIFMDEENYPMQIRYEKNEIINTKFGKINCMVFTPQLQEGRVFKDGESMKIWISDDENKLMIKVEANIIVGVIKAELSSFKGLKNPLSITD